MACKKYTPKQVLQALNESIEKWIGVADLEHDAPGASDCPLCHMFNKYNVIPRLKNPCAGCPIADAAKAPGCNNTPYQLYDLTAGLNNAQRQLAAQSEVTFLKLVRQNYRHKHGL